VSESGNEHHSASEDELSLVNAVVRDAVEGASELRYDFRQKSLLVEWLPTRQPMEHVSTFDNLSDGQKTIICLVADIARRMCLLNPHLGMNVIKETPGVILIDELDVHLHPRWQRLIVHSLKTVFPAVQFIATSHSPQILSELQPEEIILLHHDGVDHPRVSYGLDSSRVLEEIMGADARPEAVEALIHQVFAALEDKDLSVARAKIAELRATAPGLPELGGAEALLKRKEAIGR
jgi:predicted ATP-binding protein involved in virulence